MGATPDGYIKCDCCTDRVLEIKCPYTAACLDLCPAEGAEEGCIPFVTEDGHLNEKHKYYTQVQAQMALLEVKECDFVCWTPEGFSVEIIDFSYSHWDLVQDGIEKFYVDYVLPTLLSAAMKPTSVLPTPPFVKKKVSGKAYSVPPTKRRKHVPRHPCTVCGRATGQKSVGCGKCQEQTHFKCTGLKGKHDPLHTEDWFFCCKCKDEQVL